MARQGMDPRRRGEARYGGGPHGVRQSGADDGSTMMHMRPEDFGEDFAEDGPRTHGSSVRHRGRYAGRENFSNWDEDRYGYPEATSYRREMHRSDEDYAPEGRFAGDDDRGEPTGLQQRTRNQDRRYGGGYSGGRHATGQYGHGGVIDESDYRRWAGQGLRRGSGGGYGGPGGYGAVGDSAAEGDWRGDGAQGGRGGSVSAWSSRPGRFARQGPKGYTRSDERIREEICERLYHADDVDVSNVSVEVAGGTVTLQGTVPDRWMKHRVEDLCDDAFGVKDLDNRIRVSRSDARSQDSTHSPEAQAGPRH